jgi:transporter family protein
MKLTDSWQAYALASAFFAGLTAVFGKIGVNDINSNLATLLRTIVILGVLGALVYFRGEWEPLEEVPMRTLLFLTLSALATGASWLCYYHALKLAPASRVAPIDKLSVVFAMLLAFVFLKEPMSWKVLLGGGMVAAGALILAVA